MFTFYVTATSSLVPPIVNTLNNIASLTAFEQCKGSFGLCFACDAIGSLRNHDGYGNENITSKYTFELFLSISGLFNLVYIIQYVRSVL